ncbi:hypothetical protein [Legionella drancourtii]|uniref:Rap1a immunity protein domain-containing protein n=1 Tax=Legionella drancourtii LLAP12 TaxID=658187 RepID=G9EKA4_9GAMM|nr:hypothetical protein [Legionella drancourtii]EHL32255.1 hypothetical protein LDG_5628 [Legionella drancourtii LLAP12]
MIKKIAISAVCLTMFFPVISFASDAELKKVSFKKMFCDNQDFLGNSAAKRPHLHCDASFIAYKKANGDHSNISQMGDCNRTNAVFDDIKSNQGSFADYQAIYNALVLYHQAGCPKS